MGFFFTTKEWCINAFGVFLGLLGLFVDEWMLVGFGVVFILIPVFFPDKSKVPPRDGSL